MAFAARLASKRKEAEEAGEDGESNEKGLGKGGMSGLMQSKDRDEDGKLKNPFADDEDDDDQSDDEDEDDDGDLGRGESGGQSSGWNRGGWWRGALGSKKKMAPKTETFGDGRDSESDQEDEARGAGHSSDEEFGDFAMPETAGASTEAGGPAIDSEREKVLVKPLPVHPASGSGGNKSGNFLGLWPFAKKDKDSSSSSGKEEEQVEKNEGGNDDAAAVAEPEKPVEAQAAEEAVKDDEEKEAAAEEGEDKATGEEPPVVLSEDGKKVQPTVEAKRRTSIEEPDEGDEVVV